MSSLSYADDNRIELSELNILHKIKKILFGFFGNGGVTRHARIWHGKFSYALVPETSIRSIGNLDPITVIDAGDSYICIFDQPGYQGSYRIIGPGERIRIDSCNSLVTSTQPIPVDAVMRDAKAPQGFWELDGPMYLMHFSSSYRYV